MIVNMNTSVSVKLTSYGRKILTNNEYQITILKDSIIKRPLWEIAKIFGSSMYNGAFEVPFVNNEILIHENQYTYIKEKSK